MYIIQLNHTVHTEVRFASFLSGGFTTMAVINPPESKLAKRTSVQCTGFVFLFKMVVCGKNTCMQVNCHQCNVDFHYLSPKICSMLCQEIL